MGNNSSLLYFAIIVQSITSFTLELLHCHYPYAVDYLLASFIANALSKWLSLRMYVCFSPQEQTKQMSKIEYHYQNSLPSRTCIIPSSFSSSLVFFYTLPYIIFPLPFLQGAWGCTYLEASFVPKQMAHVNHVHVRSSCVPTITITMGQKGYQISGLNITCHHLATTQSHHPLIPTRVEGNC